MNRFFIVALPDSENLDKINKVRLHFNQNGFRESVSNDTNDGHITLATGTYVDENHIKNIKIEFEKHLEKKPFKLEYDHIENISKEANAEKDYPHNWLALRFYNKDLQDLADKCDEILNDLKISTTKDYVDYIHENNPDSINEKIVGDHMNICIWCLPEKAAEAYEICVRDIPKEMQIAKIAFRYTDENKKVKHAWEISL